MNLRRGNRPVPTEVVIEVAKPDELFYADPSGLLGGSNRIESGMDELVDRILAKKKPTADQPIVLEIAGDCSDKQAADVVAAVQRYCRLRQRRAHREHNLIWRQGKRALVSGSVLFVVGIALSYFFSQPQMGVFGGDLLGSGVFLVIAWVGLWYPLDLLFIAREQAKREIRVLGVMAEMPVTVRSAGRTLSEAASSGLRSQSAITLNARFRRFRGPSSAHL